MTDAQRLLAMFRQNPNKEICCTELVAGQFFGHKKIIEYTGRLVDAREVLGCTCGKDKNTCTAREHIVNTRKGYYKFITPVKPFVPPVETLIDPQKQLERLREQYREAKKNNDSQRMKMIELMAKNIKTAENPLVARVQSALL